MGCTNWLLTDNAFLSHPHAKGWKNSKRPNEGVEEAGSSSSSLPRARNDYPVSYAKGPRIREGMEEGSSSSSFPNTRRNLKRTNPFTSEGSPPRSRNDHRGLRTQFPSTRKQTLPHDSPAPEVAEAEAFLEDISDSFRPHKILKMEPVDVSLPPLPPPPADPLPNFEAFKKHVEFEKSLKLREPLPSSDSPSFHPSIQSKTTNPPASSSSSLVNRKSRHVPAGIHTHDGYKDNIWSSRSKPTITFASKSTNSPVSSSSSLISENPFQPKFALPDVPLSSQTKPNVPKPLSPTTTFAAKSTSLPVSSSNPRFGQNSNFVPRNVPSSQTKPNVPKPLPPTTTFAAKSTNPSVPSSKSPFGQNPNFVPRNVPSSQTKPNVPKPLSPTTTFASKSTNPPVSSSSPPIGQNPFQPKVVLPNDPSSQTKPNVLKPLPPTTIMVLCLSYFVSKKFPITYTKKI